MTETALADLYRDYIACHNRQDWLGLQKFVHHDVRHNGRPFGLAENVFYQFRSGKIEEVWSVIDKAAIEAQR